MKNIILLISCLFIGFNLYAEDIQIILVKGKAKVVRSDKEMELSKKTLLKDNDLIMTANKSFVRIKLNKSVVTIAPNSYYKIATAKMNSGDVNIGTLLYGHLHALFQKDPKLKRTIKTKSAALGIRGTTILLHVSRNQTEYRQRYKGKVHPIPTLEEVKKLNSDGSAFTQICCIEGLIEVQTNAGKKADLSEGQVMNFTAMGKNTRIKDLTRKTLLNSAKAFGFDF